MAPAASRAGMPVEAQWERSYNLRPLRLSRFRAPPPPRGSLSLYADQMPRLVQATLSIDENVTDGAGRAGLHIRQTLLIEEAQLSPAPAISVIASTLMIFVGNSRPSL